MKFYPVEISKYLKSIDSKYELFKLKYHIEFIESIYSIVTSLIKLLKRIINIDLLNLALKNM